jgi:hypothetical protein
VPVLLRVRRSLRGTRKGKCKEKEPATCRLYEMQQNGEKKKQVPACPAAWFLSDKSGYSSLLLGYREDDSHAALIF